MTIVSRQTVLSVGQCSADTAALSRLLDSCGAVLVRVDLHSEVASAAARQPPALILVNRVNDSDGSSGIDCIREIKKDSLLTNVPVMLVSNYADAQSQAVSAGALPGFGKSALSDPQTKHKIQQALTSPR